MRQQVSFLFLLLRLSALPALLSMAVMAALQIGLFLALRPESGDPASWMLRAQTPLALVFIGCFVVLSLFLQRPAGLRVTSHPRYTLDRLPLSPRSFLLWQSGYNTLVFLLLLAVQGLVLVGLAQAAAGHQAQGIFLLSWRIPFFHSVFPLEDGLYWLRNLVLAAGLGITAACATRKKLCGGQSLAFPALAVLAILLFFPSNAVFSGSLRFSLPLVAAVAASAIALRGALTTEQEVSSHASS